MSYTFDLSGNITSTTDQTGGTLNQRTCYFYDGRQRLTQAHTQAIGTTCGTGGYASATGPEPFKQTWTYDTDGYATSQITTLGTASATTRNFTRIAGTHRTSAVSDIAGSYTYDGAGNQDLRPGVTGLQYDPLNRMTGISRANPANNSAYAYLPSGERIRRTEGTTTTYFLGALEVVQTPTAVVGWTKRYQLAGANVAVRTSNGPTELGGSPSALVDDHQGSALLAIDASGAVVRNRYLPFGGLRSSAGVNALPTQRTYTGQTTDEASGLMYYGARYYDPATLRFTQADTLTPGSGVFAYNRYAYTNGNPVIASDPTGHATCHEGQTGAGCGYVQRATGKGNIYGNPVDISKDCHSSACDGERRGGGQSSGSSRTRVPTTVVQAQRILESSPEIRAIIDIAYEGGAADGNFSTDDIAAASDYQIIRQLLTEIGHTGSTRSALAFLISRVAGLLGQAGPESWESLDHEQNILERNAGTMIAVLDTVSMVAGILSPVIPALAFVSFGASFVSAGLTCAYGQGASCGLAVATTALSGLGIGAGIVSRNLDVVAESARLAGRAEDAASLVGFSDAAWGYSQILGIPSTGASIFSFANTVAE